MAKEGKASLERARYFDIESLYRQAEKERHFERQLQLLEDMVKLIDQSPDKFSESVDRIRILRCRAQMVEVSRERIHGGRRVADIIREASKLSVPSACLQKPCNIDPLECRHFRSALTRLQKTMCWIRIHYMTDYYKISAALFAHTFRVRNAVTLRQKAVRLATLLSDLEPHRANEVRPHQTYLEYWLSVSEGALAVDKADFHEARVRFKTSLGLGRQLNQRRCFPNYFLDLSEIAAHQNYVDALDHLHKGSITDARDSFVMWLANRPAAQRTLRFDNIIIFAKICDILMRLPTSSVSRDDWRAAERLLDRSNVARTTWVLWWKLCELKHVGVIDGADAQSRSNQLENRVMSFATSFWHLFVPDTVLLGQDRTAGLERAVVMLKPLNVVEQLDSRRHNWQRILSQNLRHLLLLMADYEHMRHNDPPPEEVTIPRMMTLPRIDERSSVEDLVGAINVYLSRRSRSHDRIFTKALNHLPDFQEAIQDNDFAKAVEIHNQIFDVIRSWPHVIKVIEQNRIPATYLAEEEEPNLLAYRMRVERLWNRQPQEATFEGSENLNVGAYYYLRPHWNIRNGDHYRTRHEQFHLTHLPQLLEIFTNNLFTAEHVKSDRFHDWILQFREDECLLCCRLFSGIRFYDKERVLNTWSKVYRQIPAHVLRGVVTGETAFVKLGHAGKSGTLHPYSFSQAIRRDLEYRVLFQGHEGKIFRDIAEYDVQRLELQKPKHIVFLDDFIGTGGQATEFVTWYFPQYPWLLDVNMYLGVLAGYEKAVQDVLTEVKTTSKDLRKDRPEITFNVLVGDALKESDRAFSEKNPVWASGVECEEAREWARSLGRELLQGVPGYLPDRDALGWKGCEALIAFEHNVPSDTLPIFWSSGMRSGKKWNWLLERYD